MENRNAHTPILDLSPQKGMNRIWSALDDLKAGLRFFPLALTLGWLDIKLRYRGSILGPLWLTLSTAIMIGALGGIYGYLFHMDLKHYLPFLSLSIVLWGYINGIISDAASVFTQSASMFHARRFPATLPVFRLLIRNVLMFLHHVLVVIVVFAFYHALPTQSWSMLLSIPLWLMNSFAITLMIGLLGARFRDIAPIMASLMQIFFFITPVIWQPSLLSATGRQYLLWDPFYPVFETLRGPLLGTDVPLLVWETAFGQGLILWIAAAVLFCRMRSRIPYWI
ncbi:ABC transporter permease [Swingsia samuiensis]|uniref:ABC transporter permease n=2 Tax=Swingsia samuiensis TaxID=1293412 RepID=A0A4Y6UNJ6_9PROT|nr:ABC transporter permease [Swingsia samuiensis]